MSKLFTDTLADLGALPDELTAALQLVVEAVVSARKNGSITLTLKIKPNGEHGVEIEDEVKFKAPAPARAKKFMFVTEDFSLIRNDPRQAKLPLREVGEPEKGDLKTA
jgi:hypothetical protein